MVAMARVQEVPMSEPIVFIGHHRVKEGKLEAFKQYFRQSVESTQADKPGTLVDLLYASEDGDEVTIIHLFANADAMDLFLQGVGKRAGGANELIERKSLEIYGTPSDEALESMRKAAGSGVVLSVNPQHLGGFARLESG
jgi:quinol monooxygenase YgiN